MLTINFHYQEYKNMSEIELIMEELKLIEELKLKVLAARIERRKAQIIWHKAHTNLITIENELRQNIKNSPKMEKMA